MPPAVDLTPAALLRRDLLALADRLAEGGRADDARSLRERVESWWAEHQRWGEELRQALAVRHDINNALVGVSGNVQLLLMGATGQQPGVRERLQVILREAGRIKEATARLSEARGILPGDIPRRAA